LSLLSVRWRLLFQSSIHLNIQRQKMKHDGYSFTFDVIQQIGLKMRKGWSLDRIVVKAKFLTMRDSPSGSINTYSGPYRPAMVFHTSFLSPWLISCAVSNSSCLATCPQPEIHNQVSNCHFCNPPLWPSFFGALGALIFKSAPIA